MFFSTFNNNFNFFCYFGSTWNQLFFFFMLFLILFDILFFFFLFFFFLCSIFLFWFYTIFKIRCKIKYNYMFKSFMCCSKYSNLFKCWFKEIRSMTSCWYTIIYYQLDYNFWILYLLYILSSGVCFPKLIFSPIVPGFHEPCLSILYFVVEWSLPSCPVIPLVPRIIEYKYLNPLHDL